MESSYWQASGWRRLLHPALGDGKTSKWNTQVATSVSDGGSPVLRWLAHYAV